MSGPFATASELCEWVGIPVPDDLARLQSLLGSSSALIRSYTGQTLSRVASDQIVVQPQASMSTGLTSTYPRAYGEVIFLPERPVVSITSVTVQAQLVAASKYQVTPEGLLSRTDGTAWMYPATIVYTHGFAETSDEFALIKRICIESAARAYTMNQNASAQFMGATTAETAGYAPTVFLTEGEKAQLEFGRAYIG